MDRCSTPTVGRDAELAVVTELVEAAAAGSGGGLLVTGEAGIGKTRLLDEFLVAASARRGTRPPSRPRRTWPSST